MIYIPVRERVERFLYVDFVDTLLLGRAKGWMKDYIADL